MYVLTDYEQETATKASRTTESRLIIDIIAARQAYNQENIQSWPCGFRKY